MTVAPDNRVTEPAGRSPRVPIPKFNKGAVSWARHVIFLLKSSRDFHDIDEFRT